MPEALSLFLQMPQPWQRFVPDLVRDVDLEILDRRLQAAADDGRTVLPPKSLWFNALAQTPPNDVSVVILGQDPYPTPGNAHGLSFSVTPGTALPASLRNIYKELASDLGVPPPPTGDLTRWTQQGVLLLNSCLTVEAYVPNSHQGWGWEALTDALVAGLSAEREHLVFVLWGSFAQKKARLVDAKKHLVVRAVHPSPLSAHRGFFGSRPFTVVNAYRIAHGLSPIDWV